MKKTILFSMIFILLGWSNAATIIGTSDLLTLGYANQIETWLGEGAIGLTRIYAKQSGHNSVNFHNAVNGQGRTIVLLEVSSHSKIIGGYATTSWTNSSDYNYTSNANAFVFNLTNPTVRYHSYNFSTAETYNNSTYGPTFGNGHDIYVNSSLSGGYGYGYAYRSTTRTGNPDISNMGHSYSIVGDGINASSLTYGKIEVFTITNNPVPEPGTFFLFSFALIAIFIRRR